MLSLFLSGVFAGFAIIIAGVIITSAIKSKNVKKIKPKKSKDEWNLIE